MFHRGTESEKIRAGHFAVGAFAVILFCDPLTLSLRPLINGDCTYSHCKFEKNLWNCYFVLQNFSDNLYDFIR